MNAASLHRDKSAFKSPLISETQGSPSQGKTESPTLFLVVTNVEWGTTRQSSSFQEKVVSVIKSRFNVSGRSASCPVWLGSVHHAALFSSEDGTYRFCHDFSVRYVRPAVAKRLKIHRGSHILGRSEKFGLNLIFVFSTRNFMDCMGSHCFASCAKQKTRKTKAKMSR